MSAYPIGSPTNAYNNDSTRLSNGASLYGGISQQIHTNGAHITSNAGALGYTIGKTPVSPAASGGDVQSLWERYGQLRLESVRKDVLIEDVLARYENLSRQHAELVHKHQREYGSQLDPHAQIARQKNQIAHLQHIMNRSPFVLVLIDGDGMIFNETYLRNGEKGGRQAAQDLKDEVTKWVPDNVVEPPKEFKVVVRVYLNLKGLADVCVRAGLVQTTTVFEEFTQGFTRGNTLFDFVDVGSGKDRADVKLNDNFKLTLYDYHCHQIIFGCSHDNGYARLLENYESDVEVQPRVTLLEGVPFEKELLEQPFKTAKFGSVFRNSKINLNPPDLLTWTRSRPDSAMYNCQLNGASGIFTPRTTTPATTRPASLSNSQLDGGLPVQSLMHTRKSSVASSANSSETTTIQTTWAKRAHKAAALPQTSLTSLPSQELTSIARHNKKGQRIDAPLDYDVAELAKVKKIKMCNQHYLGDNGCPKSGKCHHRHDYNPSQTELKLLKSVARETPCKRGMTCDEPSCIYGHRCPFPMATEGSSRGIGCLMGDGCRFPHEMHGITDFAPVKYTKVTGSF